MIFVVNVGGFMRGIVALSILITIAALLAPLWHPPVYLAAHGLYLYLAVSLVGSVLFLLGLWALYRRIWGRGALWILCALPFILTANIRSAWDDDGLAKMARSLEILSYHNIREVSLESYLLTRLRGTENWVDFARTCMNGRDVPVPPYFQRFAGLNPEPFSAATCKDAASVKAAYHIDLMAFLEAYIAHARNSMTALATPGEFDACIKEIRCRYNLIGTVAYSNSGAPLPDRADIALPNKDWSVVPYRIATTANPIPPAWEENLRLRQEAIRTATVPTFDICSSLAMCMDIPVHVDIPGMPAAPRIGGAGMMPPR